MNVKQVSEHYDQQLIVLPRLQITVGHRTIVH